MHNLLYQYPSGDSYHSLFQAMASIGQVFLMYGIDFTFRNFQYKFNSVAYISIPNQTNLSLWPFLRHSFISRK
jgi:hypothetical protein